MSKVRPPFCRDVNRAFTSIGLFGLGCSSRTFSPLFGSFREAFVVLGDSQHCVLGLQVAHLLGDGARLFRAPAPVRGVVDEGCRHLGVSGGHWSALARCLKLRASPTLVQTSRPSLAAASEVRKGLWKAGAASAADISEITDRVA
jgi:hypothetical protein